MPAGVDVGGAQRSRAGACDALCRSDHLRRLSAMNASKTAAGNDPAESAKDPERAAKPADELRIVAVNAIGEVPAAAWDACANPMANARCSGLTAQPPAQEISHNP